MDRVLLFCPTHNDVAHLLCIKARMGQDATDPPGAPNLVEYHLLTCFQLAHPLM